MEKRRRKDKTRTKHKQDLIAAGQEKMEQPAAVSKGASQLAEVTFAAGGLQGGAPAFFQFWPHQSDPCGCGL